MAAAASDVGLDLDQAPFDLLDAAQRQRVATATDIAWFKAGQQLIAAGTASASVYVVLKGRVLAADDRDRASRRDPRRGPSRPGPDGPRAPA